MINQPLSQERLKELLDYDPETGAFTWRISKGKAKVGSIAGSINPRGYEKIRIDCKHYWSHRLAWLYVYGIWPKEEIDHKNMNKSDNRIENIREASQSQNNANRFCVRKSSLKIKGVYKNGNNKYRARIQINKRRICLGLYKTPEEAHQAYQTAAKEIFGEFARFGD